MDKMPETGENVRVTVHPHLLLAQDLLSIFQLAQKIILLSILMYQNNKINSSCVILLLNTHPGAILTSKS